MSSNFGTKLKVQVFGESHGIGIGVVIDGLPPGEAIDMQELRDFMKRRAPGMSAFTTKRKEHDLPEFLSGVVDGIIGGSPVCAVIRNKDQHSSDYKNLRDVPRPSHADYVAAIKYGGFLDMRGGGHFSGRLTAPLCLAGGIALQILKRRGIHIAAHLRSMAEIEDSAFNPMGESVEAMEAIGQRTFPVIDPSAGQRMTDRIEEMRMSLDSVGGVIECLATGLPAGMGNPMFDGVENNLAKAIFGIPGVRGLEFGDGFAATGLKGSEHNDAFVMQGGEVLCRTNHAGGINGGITNGMPLLFKVAMKPTASISKEQDSVSMSKKENETLTIIGRHDPCIAVRAVPVVEAVCAIVVLDLCLEEGVWN